MARCVGGRHEMATSYKAQPLTPLPTGICATSSTPTTSRSICALVTHVDWTMMTASMWEPALSSPGQRNLTYRKQQGEVPLAGAQWQRGSGVADAPPSQLSGGLGNPFTAACVVAGVEIGEREHAEERMGRHHQRLNTTTPRRRLRVRMSSHVRLTGSAMSTMGKPSHCPNSRAGTW